MRARKQSPSRRRATRRKAREHRTNILGICEASGKRMFARKVEVFINNANNPSPVMAYLCADCKKWHGATKRSKHGARS